MMSRLAPILANESDQQILRVRRQVGALGFDATVSAPDAVLELIEDAFADLAVAPDSDTNLVSVAVTTEQRVDGEQIFRIEVQDIAPWRTDEPRAVVDHIVTSLTRTVLDRTNGRLHLHAGLVQHQGKGMLFAGASGSGKSTLVAAAVREGAGYVTDEMVSIDLSNGAVRGLAKPLTFKPNTWDLHSDLLGSRPDLGDRWSVRATRLGTLATPGRQSVDLIVFPRYGADAPYAVRNVHPAAAIVRLVTDTLDMERSGTAGFDRLVEMVAGARAVEVDYHDAKTTQAKLIGLLGSPTPPQLTAETDGSSDSLGDHDGSALPAVTPVPLVVAPRAGTRHRAPSTASFVLNGRAALYDDERSLAADLDEVATLWWLALDGQQSVADIAEMFGEAVKGDKHEIERAGNQLVDELSGVGFLQ